jgi:hypothetical protein
MLQLCNLINMLQTNRPSNRLAPRLTSPLVRPRTPQQKPTRRRTLDEKGKRAGCALDDHFDLHGCAGVELGCAGVEFFAKVDCFEASGAEDWADWWGGGGLACWAEEFDWDVRSSLGERGACFDCYRCGIFFGHGGKVGDGGDRERGIYL